MTADATQIQTTLVHAPRSIVCTSGGVQSLGDGVR
jgi:hypothetical protein